MSPMRLADVNASSSAVFKETNFIKKCVICLGHKTHFSLFITKPARYRCAPTRCQSCTAAASEGEATNQSPKQLYTRKPRRRDGAMAASTHSVNTLGAKDRPNGSALNWYAIPPNANLRYLRCLWWIGTWKYAFQAYRDKPIVWPYKLHKPAWGQHSEPSRHECFV